MSPPEPAQSECRGARHEALAERGSPRTVAFHGLGAMGHAMAGRLAAAGATVAGIDIDPAALQRWQHAFAAAPRAAHRPQDAEVIVSCVSDEAASRAVFDSGLPLWRRGALFIEHGTTSAAWAREAAARAAAAGLRYCDAPISGGTAGAERGELVVMLGAEACDVDAARAVLAAYAAHVLHLGPPGAGQLCKMANQLAIAGVAAGLAQAQAFSRAVGLDPAQVFEVLARGSAASVQLTRLQHTLGRPGNDAREVFAWLRKDLLLCAEADPAALPLSTLWQSLWTDLEGSRR